MTSNETKTLAELIAIIQTMTDKSKRDFLLVGQGIVMGEQNRKEANDNAATSENHSPASA